MSLFPPSAAEIEQYCTNLSNQSNLPRLPELLDKAAKENIPALRAQSAYLLYWLASLVKPETVLEIGTGGGVSTYVLANAMLKTGSLISLERDFDRSVRAQGLLFQYPFVHVEQADALKFLTQETGTYDLIFLDAQKRDYLEYLPHCERLLRAGGLLIADNVLFGGRVVASDPNDRPGYQEGVRLLREFNQTLADHPYFQTICMPLEDGLLMARKIL